MPVATCLSNSNSTTSKLRISLAIRAKKIALALEEMAGQNKLNALLNKLEQHITLKDRNLYFDGYDSTSTFYILLNEKCNFHCKYCYSAEGRSKAELTLEEIIISLDFFLSKDRKAPQRRKIMFIGGGEPTLSWPLVKQATEYAEEIAAKNGIELKKELTSNGSILTSEMLNFYKKHNFELQISFEVISDIQNNQRGQFSKVSENIKLLGENNINCRIRSTITELNVSHLEEMVELCHNEYPNVNLLICEPVVDPDYFNTRDIAKNFYKEYFGSFTKAVLMAKKYGINIFSSSYGAINTLREKFCGSLYCITPYATFTTCAFTSSPNESGYKDAVFGEIQEGKITFDNKAYERLTSANINLFPKCVDCWAKWNCGSGCPNQRRVYKSEIFDEICVFTRGLLRHSLLTELGEKYQKSTGKDFVAEITSKI